MTENPSSEDGCPIDFDLGHRVIKGRECGTLHGVSTNLMGGCVLNAIKKDLGMTQDDNLQLADDEQWIVEEELPEEMKGRGWGDESWKSRELKIMKPLKLQAAEKATTITIQLIRQAVRHPWGYNGEALEPWKAELKESLAQEGEPEGIFSIGHQHEEWLCGDKECLCREIKHFLVQRTVLWLQNGAINYRKMVTKFSHDPVKGLMEAKKSKPASDLETWWVFERKWRCNGECNFCTTVGTSLANIAAMADDRNPLSTFPKMEKLKQIQELERRVFQDWKKEKDDDNDHDNDDGGGKCAAKPTKKERWIKYQVV